MEDRLMSWGLVDTFRHANPQTEIVSHGLITAQKVLTITVVCHRPAARQPTAGRMLRRNRHRYEIRSMEKPSDHAPVWATFPANLAALLAQTGSGELTLRKSTNCQ